MVELFTEDAEWAAPEGIAKGHAALLSISEPEKINAVANQNTSVPTFGWRTSASPRQVAASISPYTGMTVTPIRRPGRWAVLIGEYRDKYSLTENGWRFSGVRSRLILCSINGEQLLINAKIRPDGLTPDHLLRELHLCPHHHPETQRIQTLDMLRGFASLASY